MRTVGRKFYRIGLFAVLAGSVFAGTGPRFRGMQVDAMGRSGTASVSGPASLYLNPAGLAGLSGYGVQAATELGINGRLLDYGEWAHDNHQYVSNFDSLLDHMDPRLENQWAPYTETFYLQGHYEDFAFSVVRDSRYAVTFGKSVLALPIVGADVSSDLQVAVGRGFVLPGDVNAGFTVKYVYRQYFPDSLLGTDDEAYYRVKSCWEGSSASVMDQRDKVTCATHFAMDQYGFGVNLGVNRALPYGFSVGASLLDFPTLFNGGFFYPQFNLGGAYARDFGSLGMVEALSHGVLVNLDWQFPFNTPPWFQQWKAGVALQSRMGNREIALLSLGLNDGYPSFGARLGYILEAYYLYAAEETGAYAGQRKTSFHRFGVEVNF